jgi:hypothetical protein
MALEIQAPHLADVLLVGAERTPDVVEYELVDGAGRVAALSHAVLARRASALARCGQGPAPLPYPAGLRYVAWSCLGGNDAW